MAEWQTHKTQNLAGATSCGFKSHHPQLFRIPETLNMRIFGIFFALIRVGNYDKIITRRQKIRKRRVWYVL